MDRIGRYRIVRRLSESPFVPRQGKEAAAGAGVRLRCEAERQGDNLKRNLYVLRITDEKTRASVSDSFVNCLGLRSDHVVPFVDAGSFGDHVYGAMAPLDSAVTLTRLKDRILGAIDERDLVLGAIAENVAQGLIAGREHASRGFVHDALDADAIQIDEKGVARVDAAFLDPWVGSATISASAAAHATDSRWTPPTSSETDLRSLAKLLLGFFSGAPSTDISRLLDEVRAGAKTAPRTLESFLKAIRGAADVDAGQAVLVEMVADSAGPPSHTTIGLGVGVAEKKAGKAPGAQHTLPRVRAGAAPSEEDEKPPQTTRFGSIEEPTDDGESDATIVEPLAGYISKTDEKTPIHTDIPTAALSMRDRVAKVFDEEGEEDGSTMVAPLWAAAMAKADAKHGAAKPGAKRDEPDQDADTKRGATTAARAAREKKGPPKGQIIPKSPPIPTMPASSNRGKPGPARASGKSTLGANEKTPAIGGLPVLWSDEAGPESEEALTIASAIGADGVVSVPGSAPSAPRVSYRFESAHLDEEAEGQAPVASDEATVALPVEVAQAAARLSASKLPIVSVPKAAVDGAPPESIEAPPIVRAPSADSLAETGARAQAQPMKASSRAPWIVGAMILLGVIALIVALATRK